jgi:hypothetical protein
MEVADILRAQGKRFLERYHSGFSYQQLKAFRAILRCRTAALGGHIDVCHGCGYETGISYNSCRSRSCPKCQAQPANVGSRRGNETARHRLLPRRVHRTSRTQPTGTQEPGKLLRSAVLSPYSSVDLDRSALSAVVVDHRQISFPVL